MSRLNPETGSRSPGAIMDQEKEEKPVRPAGDDGEPVMWPNDSALDVCSFVRATLRELPACKQEPTQETALACLLERMEEMRAPLRFLRGGAVARAMP